MRDVYTMASTGLMQRDEWYASKLAGRTFAVDRERGKITGVPLDNTWATDIRVLHRGSESSSFRVLSFRAKDDPHYLRIDAFQGGIEFPFIAYKGLEIFSGTCRNS